MFSGAIASGGVVKALNAKGMACATQGQIETMTECAKGFGAKGLAYIKIEGGEWKSPIVKYFGPAEKEALDATRRMLKNRTSTLVMAILFTALPFTFVFEGSRVTFLVIRDEPIVGFAWLATAAVMWASHFWIRRRLNVSGL